MKKPKNQHQLTIWYLIQFPIISLKFVINDSMFWKFGSRLGEIERKHGTLAHRDRVKFTNQFGHKSSYSTYTCIDKEKARLIYDLY